MSSLFVSGGRVNIAGDDLPYLAASDILCCGAHRGVCSSPHRTEPCSPSRLSCVRITAASRQRWHGSNLIRSSWQFSWLTLLLCLAASWLQLRTRRTPSRKPTCHSARSTNRNSQRDYARPARFAAVDASVALTSAEDSVVDEISSAPVRFKISFARFTSSEVSQCTETKIPPFCNRPS